MNDLDLCLEVISRSHQSLRYIWRWISRLVCGYFGATMYTGQAFMDMDISMDIHANSVDMDMDMDGKFHIHGNPGFITLAMLCINYDKCSSCSVCLSICLSWSSIVSKRLNLLSKIFHPAECRKRRLYEVSFVLLCFALFAFWPTVLLTVALLVQCCVRLSSVVSSVRNVCG